MSKKISYEAMRNSQQLGGFLGEKKDEQKRKNKTENIE